MAYLYCLCLAVNLFLLLMLRISLGISRSTENSTAFITFWQPPVRLSYTNLWGEEVRGAVGERRR